MKKKYIVELTDTEREELKAYANKGTNKAYKIKHANILLKADTGGPGWTDKQIAEAFSCNTKTVYNVRRRFIEKGLSGALDRVCRKVPPCPNKLDGKAEARLIAISCSEPPEGFGRWSLRLLASELVKLEIVESISPETVRQTLKKNVLKPHLVNQWVIPPEKDAEFVAAMEEVLDLYQKPLDTDVPVVNMDEQPVTLRDDIREPCPLKPGQVKRVDNEYRRNGTAQLFIFTEALTGWRGVSVRERRTAVDWAQEVKVLLDVVYPKAKRVILVCDNLNTHTHKSLFKAFSEEEANRMCSRLEIVYTPKHGSWLNIAEIELSVLTRQCLCRRIPDIETLRRETKAWEKRRNSEGKQVDWQFTTDDARIRLKRLYPQN